MGLVHSSDQDDDSVLPSAAVGVVFAGADAMILVAVRAVNDDAFKAVITELQLETDMRPL